MKKTLAIIAMGLVTSVAAFGQAEINFANGGPGLNVPFFDTSGTNKLTGTGFLADLFYGAAGTATNQLTDAGLHATFGSGGTAGIFLGGAQVLGIAAGSVELQVRVWQASAGATWAAATGGANSTADAATYGGSQWGFSAPLTLTLPASPTPTPNMIGLQALTLVPVPEPCTMVLGGLGAVGALLAYRRRKA